MKEHMPLKQVFVRILLWFLFLLILASIIAYFYSYVLIGKPVEFIRTGLAAGTAIRWEHQEWIWLQRTSLATGFLSFFGFLCSLYMLRTKSDLEKEEEQPNHK